MPKTIRSEPGSPDSLRPIFRDQTELTSGNLSDVIDKALAGSSALIVVCSPAATRSRWVNEEIRRFKQLHGSKRVFPLIVGGEPYSSDPERECFPRSLRESIDEHGNLTGEELEPLASNISEPGGRKDALLRVAAALLDVGFDQLKQREQRRRQIQITYVAIAAVLIASVTSFLAVSASLSQQEAEFRREQADDLISFMVGDLRTRLEPIGRIDVLDEVGNVAMEYFASLPPDVDPSIMSKRAMSLRQIGEVRVAQGRFDDGLRAFQQAMEVYGQLVWGSRSDPEILFHVAQTHFWIADAHFLKLDYESAEREIVNYRDVSRELATNYPENSDYVLELAMAESNLGTLSYRRSEFYEARERFAAAVQAARALVAEDPDTELYASTLATAISWLGSTEIALGNSGAGTSLHREVVEIGRQIVESSNDMRERENLARDLQVLSADLHRAGEFDEAIALDREAVRILADLVEFDPENSRWLGGFAFANLLAARHKLTACNVEGVSAQLNQAAIDLASLISIDPAAVYTRIDLHSVGVERARLAIVNGNMDEAAEILIEHHAGLLDEFEDVENDIQIRRDLFRATALLAMIGIEEYVDTDFVELADALDVEFSATSTRDAVASEWLGVLRSVTANGEAPISNQASAYSALLPACG